MKKYRKVEFYDDHFEKFFIKLPTKIQEKFIWTFQLIEIVKVIPDKYFKHVEKGVYEVRVKHSSNIYRAFAFFDKNKLVSAINGFIKKTQKIPRTEIDKAHKIKEQYEKENK